MADVTDKIRRAAQVIRDSISADFENIQIIDINVEEEEDSSGDEILMIEVVFEASSKALDARKISGAVRHIRPRLREIGEERFPLMSFVSRSDKGLGKLAPA